MSIFTKKIGIWGLGVLGKSALAYFSQHNVQLEVLENKELTPAEYDLLQNKDIPFYRQHDNLFNFLTKNDLILPSSGIDLRPYQAYAHKWISELDLFYTYFKRPIIAVTGTIGKTSITQLLGQCLEAHQMQYSVGGNIGVGLFDLLEDTSKAGALIEVSSFQLELSRTCAPDLAIWTNFYPNHLDRHSTPQEYFDAKYRILAHQKPHQQALLPLNLFKTLKTTHPSHSKKAWFCEHQPTHEDLAALPGDEPLYYVTSTDIVMYKNGHHTALLALQALPPISFIPNWLIITSALHLLDIPLTIFTTAHNTLFVPEHRLEKVAIINDIDFYNDSKSTTAQSTLAAVDRLKTKPLHLFLGGLGKGVDRSPLVAQLHTHVAHIYCFGKEAEQLHAACQTHGIASSQHSTLEDAFLACKQKIRPGDRVLFSPAGSSYDLFTDYKERGKRFKELVTRTTRT